VSVAVFCCGFCPAWSVSFLALAFFLFPLFGLASPESEGDPVECREAVRDNGAELDADGTKVEAPGSSCAEPPLVVRPSKAVVTFATEISPLMALAPFGPFLFGVRVRGLLPRTLSPTSREPCSIPVFP
jgi:hypothetical protein